MHTDYFDYVRQAAMTDGVDDRSKAHSTPSDMHDVGQEGGIGDIDSRPGPVGDWQPTRLTRLEVALPTTGSRISAPVYLPWSTQASFSTRFHSLAVTALHRLM